MCERCKHHRVCRQEIPAHSAPTVLRYPTPAPWNHAVWKGMKGSQSVAASPGFKIRFKNVRESILLETSSSSILLTPRCWSFDPVRVTPSEPTLSMKPSIRRRSNTSIVRRFLSVFLADSGEPAQPIFLVFVRPRITGLEADHRSACGAINPLSAALNCPFCQLKPSLLQKAVNNRLFVGMVFQ